jgi:hypothetical protein
MIDYLLTLKRDEIIVLNVTYSDLRGFRKGIRGQFIR